MSVLSALSMMMVSGAYPENWSAFRGIVGPPVHRDPPRPGGPGLRGRPPCPPISAPPTRRWKLMMKSRPGCPPNGGDGALATGRGDDWVRCPPPASSSRPPLGHGGDGGITSVPAPGADLRPPRAVAPVSAVTRVVAIGPVRHLAVARVAPGVCNLDLPRSSWRSRTFDSVPRPRPSRQI